MTCPVCGADQEILYRSGSPASVTSICTLLPSQTQVSVCNHCVLASTVLHPSQPLRSFWTEYHAAQAQMPEAIYSRSPAVLRSEHEYKLIGEFLGLPEGATALAWGGVRIPTLRLLIQARPDIALHVFLEDAVYAPLLDGLVSLEDISVGEVPETWTGFFDAVISLYDLAHHADPKAHLAQISSLVKPDGRALFAVPNLLTNTGDWMVANHLSHFTTDSLGFALRAGEWADVTVDDNAFAGRLVAVATKAVATRHGQIPPAASTLERLREINRYWIQFGERVRAFESEQDASSAAIYGAGFYGAFILSQLRRPEQIGSFYDGNAQMVGKKVATIPVQALENGQALPPVLYVGLNPQIAASVGSGLHREGLATFLP